VGVLDKNAFLAKTNEKTVKKILKIKQQMAQLNGFETFADLSLSQKMAGSTKTVIDFFETIKISLLEQAKQEYQELESYFKQHNPDKEMQPWDSLFWRNKLQKARYNFNEKELTPYLNVEATINGVFEVIKRLYQVELVYNKDIPVYANDVLAYEVFDSSSGQRQKMGLVYLDLFERPGEKQRGAWAFPVQSHATDQLPIIGISANFTKSPEGWKKSQLEIDDVITLFHEFGHGMHNLLSTSPYSSLSGTKVAWDFVEFPSQWFEKFASQYEVLKLFARHSKTGEVIPEELVKRYNNSENFFSATLTLKQLSMAWTDMAYYMKADAFNKHDDLYAFERHIHQPLNVAPFDTKFLLITDFPHVVTGGYPAGYYGYLWSNVLSVDAFNMFKKNGLFNPDWAEKIKTLLAKGNTEDPLDAFKQMMGREPNPNALVESLLQNDEH
jgi:Zn-dependent oligopeptidase